MEYEIIKTEGWGKLGTITVNKNIITPHLLETSKYKKERGSSKEIGCIIYPSLQTQGKDINSLKTFFDLFPSDFNEFPQYEVSFHVIPWDLPSIYLGEMNSYLKRIFDLEKKEDLSNNKDTFILNIPFVKFHEDIFAIWRKSKIIRGAILGDISSLLTNPRFLIEYFKLINPWVNTNKLFFASGIPQSYIPALTYLGIDMFDTMYLDMNSISLSNESELLFELIKSRTTFQETIELTRKAIKIGKLRDLVKVYSNSYPPLKAMLRIIDKELLIEKGTPLITAKALLCTDETDFTRPEVVRFRNRVKTRYFPSEYQKGVIFLPCSAKKPYSQSRSHRFFQKTIRRQLKGRRRLISEAILTSPLGVVPRELEYSYPAAHYDIPVTGDWSNIEKDILIEDITNFLLKFDRNVPIIGGVLGAEREALEYAAKKVNKQVYLLDKEFTSLTSRDTLSELSLLLREGFKEIKTEKVEDQTLRFLKVITDFQFGIGVSEHLFTERIRIFGRKEIGLKVSRNGEHIVTFNPSKGLLTISLIAATLIKDHTPNKVIFEGEKIIGSTVFTKGIRNANPQIRAGDEVIVLNTREEIIGVGTSYLAGDLLSNMMKGKGISIRKKVK